MSSFFILKTMTQVGQLERPTQDRIVKLFVDRLKYNYLGDWKDRDDNSNVEENLLRDYLIEQKVNETLALGIFRKVWLAFVLVKLGAS